MNQSNTQRRVLCPSLCHRGQTHRFRCCLSAGARALEYPKKNSKNGNKEELYLYFTLFLYNGFSFQAIMSVLLQCSLFLLTRMSYSLRGNAVHLESLSASTHLLFNTITHIRITNFMDFCKILFEWSSPKYLTWVWVLSHCEEFKPTRWAVLHSDNSCFTQ